MSVVLEFLTPQNPEASSAGIRTNWCLPTIAWAARATGCSGGTTTRPKGSTTRDDQPTSIQGNPPDSVTRSPIATPTLRNCQ
jgi:hypothetical protein